MVHQPILTPFQWIEVIVRSRSNNNNEDITDLTVNDVRNGMLVNQIIHSSLESRQVAFLKVVVFASATDKYPL
jgi:hypothetical protein